MHKYINAEKVHGNCHFCKKEGKTCFDKRGSHRYCWEFDVNFAADVVERNNEVINADELTEELEKQREFKDSEYCKGINAMLDTALMIIHNLTLGDEIAEKGEKQNG